MTPEEEAIAEASALTGHACEELALVPRTERIHAAIVLLRQAREQMRMEAESIRVKREKGK